MRALTTGELKTLVEPENEVSWLDIRGVAERGGLVTSREAPSSSPIRPVVRQLLSGGTVFSERGRAWVVPSSAVTAHSE